MKNIMLIGDSIRIGYDRYVKEAFRDVANVYYPNENCRFAAYATRHFADWRQLCKDSTIDLLHWNAGLWDCLVLPDGECLTPPEVYKFYLERVCKEIDRLFANAKVIFATSTPVEEKLFWGHYKRHNKTIELYNSIAVEVVEKYGHKVNDLYSLLKDCPPEFHSDCTHFYTKQATKLISGRVIQCIENELDIKASDFEYDDLFVNDPKIIGM